MALTKSTYTQTESADQFQDVTISPATVSDGTLRQRFDTLAFPRKGVKQAGSVGPTIPSPVLAIGALVGAGGTWAAGNVFWVLTALNAKGETLASNEVTATVAAASTAPLSWAAVPGATGYKLYRGTVAGAENVLAATLGAVTSFNDTGAAGTAATPPATDTTGILRPTPARPEHGAGS